MADRRSPDNDARDVGDQERVLNEVAQVLPSAVPLKELHMFGERFAVSDEAEAETIGSELRLCRSILRFVVDPEWPQPQEHVDMLLMAGRRRC